MDNRLRITSEQEYALARFEKAFEDLKVVIPDEKNVFEFDSISSSIDSQIKRTVQESRRLAELRDTLLPRLMSGELKVNDVDA